MAVVKYNTKGKLWFGFCPYHSLLFVLIGCLALLGCTEKLENDMENVSEISVSVKSSDVNINSLDIWAFYCDSQGKVSKKENVGYFHADGRSDISFNLASESKYYFLLSGVNLPASMSNAGSAFNTLTTTKFNGFLNESIYTHWAFIDIDDAVDGSIDLPIELFPLHGKLTVNATKVSDAITMVIDRVDLCSTDAPQQGAFFSALSAGDIKSGGLHSTNWYFDGVNLNHGSLLQNIAENVALSESKTTILLGESSLYEIPDGWRDLTLFKESGWELDPSVADADCKGCYLSISYRFVKAPETSLESENAVQVQKYIPLPPICRGNEYRVDIKINLDDIIVYSSTEVSEEIGGIW